MFKQLKTPPFNQSDYSNLFIIVYVIVHGAYCVHTQQFYLVLCLVCCLSQLPSMCLWSYKEGTVPISSPSYVDTVTMVLPHCGYTMGHWRVVMSLALPSQEQCTLFKLKQNTQQLSVEWTVYEH